MLRIVYELIAYTLHSCDTVAGVQADFAGQPTLE